MRCRSDPPLELPASRCVPSLPCGQRERCMRAAAPADLPAIDASRAAHAHGWCTIFLDVNAVALLRRAS